jgi:hypothetical protein
MGSAKLDLRRDDLPDRVDVQVRSVMGDVEVLVPRAPPSTCPASP